MITLPVQTRRWSRVEYERLIDRGVFQPGERIELIDGLLVVREPQSSPHFTGAWMPWNYRTTRRRWRGSPLSRLHRPELLRPHSASARRGVRPVVLT